MSGTLQQIITTMEYYQQCYLTI